MPDFSQRSEKEELMDDLLCQGEVIDQTLRELEVINKWLGGNHVTINGIRQLVNDNNGQLTVADLGCGGGDILKLLAQWARKQKKNLKLIGIDANPHIIDFAKRNCSDYPEIQFQITDIFSEEFKSHQYDIITSTLYTHHFTDTQIIGLYKRWLHKSRLGIVVNDLHRHWFAYYSIKLITSLFSKSPMVKNDAALSVERSFIKKDLTLILHKAGTQNYFLKWMWAFRWQLIIRK